MADLNSVKGILNRGYDQFQNYGLNRVLETVNQNQAGYQDLLNRQYGQGTAALGNQRASVLGSLANTRQDINQNTQNATQNIQQSIENSLGAFGRNPQNIGSEPAPDYSEVAPALTQLQNRVAGQFQGQGTQLANQVGRQEQDVNAEYDDYGQRLQGWKKQKESQALINYQNQRMAVERERSGSQLERRLMMANLAVSLQNTLKNINSAYSTIASSGGY